MELGHFSLDDSKRIASTVSRLERFGPLPVPNPSRPQQRRTHLIPVFFQAPSGGLPARTAGGRSTATMCQKLEMTFDGSTIGFQALAGTENEIEVHNWAEAIVCDEGDRYGIAFLQPMTDTSQDPEQIIWLHIVHSEYCIPDSGNTMEV